MAVKGIQDIDIKGKKVFFRFDFNVPLGEGGEIKDETRIVRAIPTIRYAINQGARSILSSHLGRPKGERKPELSLRPVAQRIRELLGCDVRFVEDCIGPEVRKAVDTLPEGGVLLLENLRFHPGETRNDPNFARELALLAEVYVNDAFGTAHRAHASTEGVARLLPVRAAGLLMKEELDNLAKAFSNPEKPVVALFGGAKVSDKIAVLKNIMHRMDTVLIGGGMANTFLKAQGATMGASQVEEDLLDIASEMGAAAEKAGCTVVLPSDVVIAERIEQGIPTEVVDVQALPHWAMALDIGPKTVEAFARKIAEAKTIIWNGPMGVFELEAFSRGTMEIARAVTFSGAFSVIGGGDTIRAVQQAKVADKISYISTGGGAFMEFMEGKVLPGIAALEV